MPRKQNILNEVGYLKRRLTNKANRARRAGNRRLEAGQEVIRDLAEMYAPEDEGNLGAAIKTRVTRGEGGRNAYEVYIDESAPGSNGAGSVGKYALLMHESSDYQLGKNSQAKDADVGGNGLGYPFGGKVGRKFLTRAFRDYQPKLERQIKDAIRRGLK